MIAQPSAAGECIAVAMSGGLDSSVAAYLLLHQGWRVLGVSMRLWRHGFCDDNESDLRQAARVCAHLGIAHRVIDLRDEFRQTVIEPLAATYAAGRTPNPCPRCNRAIKFGALRRAAQSLGCAWFATGHYARIVHGPAGPRLLRGRDLSKDQSYVLYAISRDALAHTMLPLGDLLKDDVRSIAAKANLPVLGRSESQDLCFVPDGDHGDLVRRMAPQGTQPGPIRGINGELLGTHRGLAYYTVGQRRGLGIAAPRPYYVLRLDAASNTVVVGHAEDLGRQQLEAVAMCYHTHKPPAPGSWARVKVRYRAAAMGATIWPYPGRRARVVFTGPLRDITPGQAVVLYRGECVLGGGIIERALA